MTQGLAAGELGPTSGLYAAPPDDTGEAIGLPAAGLTITFGFGPTLFRKEGRSRFGLADRQLAYVRDPRTQFIPIQMKLGLGDGLSEYLQHTGSGPLRDPAGYRPRGARRPSPLLLN
jgi:hypothetical protein